MKRHTVIMMGVILIYGIAYFIFGETVPQNGGFGWDGLYYKTITQNFHDEVFIKGLDSYYIQRISVPALLYTTYKIIGIPLNDINTLWGYKIFNLVLLIVSIYFYNLIANELRFKDRVRWLGFCSLYISYAVLKQNFYYPVLLDTAIFALSIIQFYFYLRNNVTALVIITVIGGFTWPTLLYTSLVLILFPLNRTNEINKSNKIRWFIITIILILLTIIVYSSYLRANQVLGFGVSAVNNHLLLLSLISLLLYMFFALRYILDNNSLYVLKSYLKSTRWVNLLIVFIIFLCICIIIYSRPHGIGLNWQVRFILLTSVTQPLIFLISHIIYFGPSVIIIIYYWRSITQTVHSFGIGITLYILFFVFMSINSQSRQIINGVPLFIFFTMIIINRFEIKTIHIVFFFLVSILFSKFWFIFNIKEFSDGTNGSYQKFPDQNYWMNHGPWMSFDMYLLQGMVVVITGLYLYYFIKRKYKLETNDYK